MRITLVPMIAMFVATILYIPLCVLFMHKLDLGIIGLAVALVVKDFVLFLTVTIYGIYSDKISQALVPIDIEAFRGWRQYLEVSLPTTVMICAEWWAFEVIAILAGTIGVVELAS